MPASRTLISVALCTYNGERFLEEQLASIEAQTRLPDELIICDDRSTDRTGEIVQAFARKARFPVIFQVNERTLGSTKNFEQAISRCSGNLIALSDQDDIWNDTRLQRSEDELRMHPEALLVFSDADIIDAQGRVVGTTLWESFHFDAARRAEVQAGEFDLYVKSRFVTGATVMFRRALRERLVPAGADWFHDEWLVALTAVFGQIRPIDERLIRYRQHEAQQIGPSTRRSRSGLILAGMDADEGCVECGREALVASAEKERRHRPALRSCVGASRRGPWPSGQGSLWAVSELPGNEIVSSTRAVEAARIDCQPCPRVSAIRRLGEHR